MYQELCKKLHQQIDTIDEERYDLEAKVSKANKEVKTITPQCHHLISDSSIYKFFQSYLLLLYNII